MDSFILKQLTCQIAYSLSIYRNVPLSQTIYSNVPFFRCQYIAMSPFSFFSFSFSQYIAMSPIVFGTPFVLDSARCNRACRCGPGSLGVGFRWAGRQ